MIVVKMEVERVFHSFKNNQIDCMRYIDISPYLLTHVTIPHIVWGNGPLLKYWLIYLI